MALMAAAPVVTFALLQSPEPSRPARSVPAASNAGGTFVGELDAPVPAAPAPASHPRDAFHAYVVLPWVTGVVALSAWRVCGWVVLCRMVRTCTVPASDAVRRAGEALRRRLGISRAVRLVESAWVQVPSVMGVLRPVVLLPASALSGLSAAQLEAILAHELAHVRRHDYLVNLLQSAAETLLFYHPAVWWVSRVVREERELCCDEVAAAACGDRVLYARALADLESLRALPGGLALSARGGSLSRRVRRLLGVEAPPAGRPALPAAAVLAVALVLLPLVAHRLGAAPGSGQPSDRFIRATADGAAPGDAASVPAAKEGQPLEEDFVPAAGDYKIGPGDLLAVTISDLQGPGIETVKNARVTNTGEISLPHIGVVSAKGLTEQELEAAIKKDYQAEGIIHNAQVSVAVSEARQNLYSVVGDGLRPGIYKTGPGDYRLLDALATAQAGNDIEQVLVIRKPTDPNAAGRVITIPGEKLLAGEGKYNVVVRPGDVIRVTAAAAARPVRLVVKADGRVALDGREATWDELPALLEKTNAGERARTRLLLVAESEDMTFRQMRDALNRAEPLAARLGLKGVAVDYPGAAGGNPKEAGGGAAGDGGGAPPEMRRELPQAPGQVAGTYYMGGHALRPGAYTIAGRTVTLRQALIAAGLPEGAAADHDVTVLRRSAGGEEWYKVRLDEVLRPGDRNGTAPLHDGDQVLLRKRDAGENGEAPKR